MRKILKKKFFDRPAPEVAPELLGKFLISRLNGKETALMITEVEAYGGLDDLASHSHRGKTGRNFPMFGGPGKWYVYFTYGMYWLVNIVTGPGSFPSAVLLRSACLPETGKHFHGPALLARYLKVTKLQNNCYASKISGFWIEDRGINIPKNKIKKGPRVGVGYSGPLWSKKNYRFYLMPGIDPGRRASP